MSDGPRKKICIVTSSPFIVRVFLTQHANVMAEHYDVTVICNVAESDVPLALADGVRLISVRIERNIRLWRDIVALFRLYRLFYRERFSVVHSVSPKGGMLAQIAAWLARVPCRLHTFTGQVWVTRTGLTRWLLKSTDRLYAWCATHVLVDSPSQRQFLLDEGVVSGCKGQSLGAGSISGVDIHRFVPNGKARTEIRRRFNIPANATVFLYLGRLKRDKGVVDLAAAFADHAGRCSESWLVLVGPDEEHLAEEIRRCCVAVLSRVVIDGFTPTPEMFIAAADVLCLPSYREGFGSVIIEAGACGIPAIGSRIYGITDAIVHGKTGWLHEPGDRSAIAALLDLLARDHMLRNRMGSEAKDRVLRSFSKEASTDALLQYYQLILSKLGKSDGYGKHSC